MDLPVEHPYTHTDIETVVCKLCFFIVFYTASPAPIRNNGFYGETEWRYVCKMIRVVWARAYTLKYTKCKQNPDA